MREQFLKELSDEENVMIELKLDKNLLDSYDEMMEK